MRSKGLCVWCREKQRRAEGEITMSTRKTKPKSDKKELDEFFDRHVELLKQNPRSSESGKPIHNPSRLHIAHLMPKRVYKSVQTLDANTAYLTWQEHSDFDKLLDQHRFEELEKKFPRTWNSLLKVLPLCKENGKLKIAIEEHVQI